VVDRSLDSSLESLAADRGITICFADLDGADGLWLPEERTILLARGLTAKQAAEVLEHELAHVDIEDGHAALDAAMHKHAGRARWAVAGTAAASLALLFGIQLHLDGNKPTADSHPAPQVAAVPSHSSGRATPTSAVTPSTKIILVNGEVRTQTVTVTPPAPPPPTGVDRPASTRAATEETSQPPVTTKSGNGVAPATQTSAPPDLGAESTTPQTTTPPPVDTLSPSPQPSLSGANVT
jgi:hypothetical protein